MKAKYSKPLLLSIIILSILVWLGYQNTEQGITFSEAIHIAFVGPLSGSGAPEGTALLQSVKLYIDEVNRNGGVNGRQIVLDEYDDQNTPIKAKEQALEIVKQNQAVAVIGHYYSSCSLSAGEVYQQSEIPAITPGSTNVKVTEDNPWYFRTIFHDDLQGRFMANYLKKVLQYNTVTIIHHDDAYGKDLARAFKDTFQNLGAEVKHEYKFQGNDANLTWTLQQIVDDLATQKDTGFIFLGTYALEGVELVRLLKDKGIKNPIIVPAAFDSKTFQEGFDNYPEEKKNPGYYTNGIYITTPLIFDTANEKAQKFKEEYQAKYQEEANLRTPFAYDAAMLLISAIKNTGITGQPPTIQDDRKTIREYLAKIDNSSEAIEGTTGYNYFNDKGDAQKTVAMGVYKNNNIISALVQLQSVRNPNEIQNLDKATEEGRVIDIDEQYFYKTNVVYVGVKINEITDFDLENLTFIVDFYLWFRFQGNIKPQDIEFLNAVEPFDLEPDKPTLVNTITATTPDTKETTPPARLIKVETQDQITHRLYRIKSNFKADFLPTNYIFNQHSLGVSFRHRDLTRNNLIYVTDILGMGLTKQDIDTDTGKLDKTLVQSASLLDWTINKPRFFQDIVKENALGSLKYLDVLGGMVEYSQFNMNVLITSNKFSIRRAISHQAADNILLVSSIIILLLAFKHSTFRRFSKLIWVIQALFAFLLLLSSEVVLLARLIDETNTTNINVIIKAFDMLWWIIPAILLHSAIEQFLWVPLEEKSGRNIPRIGRRFVSFTIYLMTFFAILAFVYDQRLTSLLATSGVIAMIIGLAIQINISNIFSGIAINIEHPFRVGDWVQIGTFDEGKVVDITWRTTRIITRMGCILSIPNSVASESTIHNYDYPDDTFWLRFIVHVHPAHPPQRVQKIIRDAVISTEVVLKTPDPFIIFRGLSDWAADYMVYFAVRDYAWRLLHEEAVWTRIWVHLNRAGIAPAIQRQEIHLFKGMKERGEEAATKPLTLLREIDLFRPFSEEAKLYLSEHMHIHRISAGEIIVRQGDTGNSLFIIIEGVVGVRVLTPEKESIEVARLGAGNFFGEMALLTGEDRTATVIAITDSHLFEITKEDIAPLMEQQTEVTEMVSKVLTQRQMMTKSQMHVQHDIQVEEDALHKRLLDRIEKFFGLTTK